jgi:hypothetical protein
MHGQKMATMASSIFVLTIAFLPFKIGKTSPTNSLLQCLLSEHRGLPILGSIPNSFPGLLVLLHHPWDRKDRLFTSK